MVEQKSNRGGTREGAGRKSNAEKLLRAGFVANWFTSEFQQIKWKSLVESDDERISLEAMKYLSDRLFGKPRQELQHTGPQGGPIQASISVVLVRPNGSDPI